MSVGPCSCVRFSRAVIEKWMAQDERDAYEQALREIAALESSGDASSVLQFDKAQLIAHAALKANTATRTTLWR